MCEHNSGFLLLHVLMQKENFRYADEQFADLQMLRYRVDGFEKLTLRQKKLVYYLSQAALYGRDILWDQNGRYNLAIRYALEAIYKHADDALRQSAEWEAFVVYLKRVWFSNGIHHHYGCEKFAPEFTVSFFEQAIKAVYTRHAQALPLAPGESIDKFIATLTPIIFDPTIMPKRVNQAQGEDLVTTSACNYYGEGVTQKEVEAYYASMPVDPEHPVMKGMNSRLVKDGQGQLKEIKWKEDGLYGKAIHMIIHYLEKAARVAENERQEKVILKLIEFYRNADLKTFDDYTILWVQETLAEIDFTNGFTETYGDPLGLKASWEGYVNFIDKDATARAAKLSENAQWFEDHSPVDARFKKSECKGVSARVIKAAILGGDLYPASAIGINLPNSNWVRATYGSKSVTIGNLTDAYSKAAHGNGFREEFVVDDATLAVIEKYEDALDDLHTDLHECLGHGSGKLLPGVDPDALRAYGATIEEARADLFGLYYIADEKLVRLGLTPDSEAYKAQYYSYIMNGLMTQLVRIEPGKDIEESHMRNRALIAHWVYEQGRESQVITWEKREGKSYIRINDYAALRKLFARLLAEIQRIKSEGDYEAARKLVETHAVKVDASLHQEVLERYQALHLSPYKGFINPIYTPQLNQNGEITDVLVSYGEAYDRQMLRYSRDYANLPIHNY